MQEITGRCNALNDSTFSFATKSSETYEVVVNFTCELNFTKTTRLISIILPVTY